MRLTSQYCFANCALAISGIVTHSDKCNAFRRFGGQPLSNVTPRAFLALYYVERVQFRRNGPVGLPVSRES